MTSTFKNYIDAFADTKNNASLSGIGRGIEREGLRVLPEGKLSNKGHFTGLGSALTHPNITTDYAETLLEFITPVSQSPEQSIAQLQDIQKYTLSHIDGELIWPMSMPCFVENDDDITIAQYGSSNIATMKTVYRQGLKNRYGSMMQVIAGIHFNFSFSAQFWQVLQKIDKSTAKRQDYISDKYFATLRNYKRFCWLIPYLYGSSPAICASFLQNKPTNLPFKRSKSGYLYLEYATSLRMSDLGYTNDEQAGLQISYNSLDSYLAGVKQAINLDSAKFSEIGIKVDGKYKQLNSHVLQIENELYAPIRPKQVAKSGEKPSEALASRGVEYIEVRALDINPFADTGISVEQIYFLDIFLTYCTLMDSADLDEKNQQCAEQNMAEVVIRGRDPELRLHDGEQPKSIAQWGGELFDEMKFVAQLLDQAYATDKYCLALATERQKLFNSQLTPSAKILATVVEQQQSLIKYSLDLATSYREKSLNSAYQHYDLEYFDRTANASVEQQREIENADQLTFDQFLQQYFSQ